MLPDLLQIDERVLQPLADSRHATKCCPFQLFALEQRLPVLEQTHVITRNRLDERLGSVELTEGNSEVIRIVESIEQITVERVDILEAREGFDRGGEALGEGLSGVLDFSRVESSNSADLETGTDL